MAMTNAQLLGEIETAITTVLTGTQSYTIDGASFTRADLKTLRDWRRDILNQIERADTSDRRVAEF